MNDPEYINKLEESKYDDVQESTALDIDADEDYDILNINKVI